jgi:hypothetical protein
MFSVFPLVIVAILESELVSVTGNPEEEDAISVLAASPTLAVAGSKPKVIVCGTLAVACMVRMIWPEPPAPPAFNVPVARAPLPPPPGPKPFPPIVELVVGPVPPLPPPPSGATAPTLLVAVVPFVAIPAPLPPPPAELSAPAAPLPPA